MSGHGRLTPHQRDTLMNLRRRYRAMGGRWIEGPAIGSRGAMERLCEKGYAERRDEVGPRGGELRCYRPLDAPGYERPTPHEIERGYRMARELHGADYENYLREHDAEHRAKGLEILPYPLCLQGNDGD